MSRVNLGDAFVRLQLRDQQYRLQWQNAAQKAAQEAKKIENATNKAFSQQHVANINAQTSAIRLQTAAARLLAQQQENAARMAMRAQSATQRMQIRQAEFNQRMQHRQTMRSDRLNSGMSAFTGGVVGGVAAMGTSAVFRAGESAVDSLIGAGAWGAKIAMEAEKAKVGFEVMLKSGKAADQMMKQIEDFAVKTPFDQTGLTKNIVMLRGMGIATEDLLPAMKTLGDLSLGDNEKLGGLALAYGQVMTKGRLMGQEMNQLAERGINLRQDIANNLKIPLKDVSKAMEQGKVSAAIFRNALIDLAEREFGGMMEKQTQTMSGQLDRFGENAGLIFKDLATTILETFDIKQVIVNANKELEKLRGVNMVLKPDIDDAARRWNNLKKGNIEMFGGVAGAIAPAAGGMARFFERFNKDSAPAQAMRGLEHFLGGAQDLATGKLAEKAQRLTQYQDIGNAIKEGLFTAGKSVGKAGAFGTSMLPEKVKAFVAGAMSDSDPMQVANRFIDKIAGMFTNKGLKGLDKIQAPQINPVDEFWKSFSQGAGRFLTGFGGGTYKDGKGKMHHNPLLEKAGDIGQAISAGFSQFAKGKGGDDFFKDVGGMLAGVGNGIRDFTDLSTLALRQTADTMPEQKTPEHVSFSEMSKKIQAGVFSQSREEKRADERAKKALDAAKENVAATVNVKDAVKGLEKLFGFGR